jgi:hypothetical protein
VVNKNHNELIYEKVDQELMIDIKNLNGELMDQALLMRKWTKAKSMASKRAKAIRNKLEYTKAQIYRDGVRKGWRVGDIQAEVTANPTVQELTNELTEAEYELEQLEGIVRAFYQKHDALKDLSANVRKGVED